MGDTINRWELPGFSEASRKILFLQDISNNLETHKRWYMEKILILDFGSQYTQLIARKVRELKVFSEIQPFNYPLNKIKADHDIKALILSGGPASVYSPDAPQLAPEIFELNLPILGICYGLQQIAHLLGGSVNPSDQREYGRAQLTVSQNNTLLSGLSSPNQVWMSHCDHLTRLPPGFEVIARTENSPMAAIQSSEKQIYGLQFHPEVHHTSGGLQIIKNFLFDLCHLKESWSSQSFITTSMEDIRQKVGKDRVLCGLSGGVDSSVAAALIHQAIGEQLHCVLVDTGLLRANEVVEVQSQFEQNIGLSLTVADARETFLERLKGIIDPEKKRKIIGQTFIEVFEKHTCDLGKFRFLAQGTLYPDVIESVSFKGPSVTIKSHHNVGGLPEKMNFELLEPFRELFKDEVREIGRALKLPAAIVDRHPFPGPGLAVRIPGEITSPRLEILRKADKIFIDALKHQHLYHKIWQAFCVLLPIQTVGVMGDLRTYENVVALRAVTSTDGMTADWYPLPYDFLADVSNRIINEVKGINRVVYDISSKPPATIEWE